MTNAWERQGLIRVGHRAQMPIVDTMPDRWRIHYSTRDTGNRSIPLWVDVEPGTCHVIRGATLQTMPLGQRGQFDVSGVMPSSIISLPNGVKHLYYVGWSRRADVPYHNATGVATSRDGGITYGKVDGPILSQSLADPYFTGTFYPLLDQGVVRGWYMSCVGWDDTQPSPEARYCLKNAVSDDGLHWTPGMHAIPLRSNEGGICQATVVRSRDVYRMWYSYRGRDAYRDDIPTVGYRIGYAHSRDGLAWTRDDDAFGLSGIVASSHDDQMQAYPCVIRYEDELYMFYSGNGFGRDGILWCTTRA